MKSPALLLIFSFPTFVAVAQSHSENIVNLNISIGTKQGALAGSYCHNWFIGKNEKVIIGLGTRFTGFVGRSQYFVTAPARLTSDGTGPLVIFKENITANMDSFLLKKPGIYALNAMINLGYKLNSTLKLGFNIDLVGVSFGSRRQGNYINGQQSKIVNAKVTPFNVLLISDNDQGSLNSELYGDYTISDRWLLRAGFQFLFTEYTTASKVQLQPEPNDRFRKKSLMFMVGIGFLLHGNSGVADRK